MLAHFAPVLGNNREKSSRKDVPQEITMGRKVDHGIDENSPTGVLDDTTILDPATLLKKCPKRHAFVKKTVDAWTAKPDPAKAGKDDKK